MFSSDLKQAIAEKVQAILQETGHVELPEGEVQFILHVDGAENWSWANIRNNAARGVDVPGVLVQNLSVGRAVSENEYPPFYIWYEIGRQTYHGDIPFESREKAQHYIDELDRGFAYPRRWVGTENESKEAAHER